MQVNVDKPASQRKQIATNDAKHSVLVEDLTELKDKEDKVTETLIKARSSLELVKDQIVKLKLELKSLIEKREKKQSSRRWLTKKIASMSEEVDLAEVNKLIRDIEEVVDDINKKINELEIEIKTQNEQVAEMEVQLVQKEQEKKQLEIEMDEVKKKKESLEDTLEEDRRSFEDKMQSLMKELSEVCYAGFDSWFHILSCLSF